MIKRLHFPAIFFGFLCVINLLQAFSVNLPAKVSVDIPANSAIAGREISCEVTILRLANQKVDASSFQMDGAPLKVAFVEDQYPSSTRDPEALVVSRYRFTLPGKEAGLYVLPSLSVKVEDNVVSSNPVSYEVINPQKSSELTLEARVVEKGPFYPGQTITFEYRISFKQPIQLTKEEIPLLEFQGFRNVGAPKVESVAASDSTVQIISQQAVALQPGTYQSGVSTIEGYVYSEDESGTKSFVPPLLIAQTPSIDVAVLPFPPAGKPLSFNGAVGVLHWRVKLIGSKSVVVGEKVELEVLVSGTGEFDTVNLPDLRLQRGFKNAFRLSDLPPAGEMKEGTKRFVVELWPLSPIVSEIPLIEFSSFDPLSKTYVIQKSDPIPITVRQGAAKQEASRAPKRETSPSGVEPIEIQGNIMLEESELRTRHMDTILLFYAFIFLVVCLGIEQLLRRLTLDNKRKREGSRDIFMEAIKQKTDPDLCCRLIQKALLLRLFEIGQTSELFSLPEQLATTGLQGEIRNFLSSIEKKRFMGLETSVEIKDIIAQASELYYRMKSINGTPP